ncbi:MAG: hypothetical protein D6695_01810 [Planctomycetota bacterium]|nr:MAG: hypothetical protein D6695_01810 [Planctomycetota bacterium]
MSARTARRNNALAGFFLLLSLVLAVVMSFWVSDLTERWGRFSEYVVSFSLRDGATGLEKGSPVLLGGKNVGRVEHVDWRRKGDDPAGLPVAIDVKVKVRADVPLYSNAVVNVERPILGGLASINIISPGGPGEDAGQPAELLAEGGVMHGGLAPGLLAQAGLGPEQVEQIKSTIEKVNAAMDDIKIITGAIAPNADKSVRDIDAMIEAARATIEAARDDYHKQWSPRVTEILETGQRISNKAERITDTGNQIADNLLAGVDEARGVINSAQQTIDDNRADIDQIIDNVNETTRHFKEQTTTDIDTLMARGNSALEEFERVGNELGVMLDEFEPEVTTILTNVRLTSMDARLFLNELKAQPWRLLRAPNTKEMERQLLYSAARAYASAVSDLKAASESLEAVLKLVEAGQAPSLTPDDVAVLQERVRQAFIDYQQAEEDLYDAIVQTAPSQP